MTTETQPEQPILTDDETSPEEVGERPASHRVAYKAVPAAIVIGIITISALWILVNRQEGSPVYEVSAKALD